MCFILSAGVQISSCRHASQGPAILTSLSNHDDPNMDLRGPHVALPGSGHISSTDSISRLWEEAIKALSEKDKSSLPLNQAIRPDTLLADTNEQINRTKGRAITLPTGETFLVRDALEKIARWVKKFVEVGDVAVQYDSGHAALPWAALRAILRVRNTVLAAR